MHTRIQQRSDYTFKYNRKLGRHGWLRLTPAYSVKLVNELLEKYPKNAFILDPFSGTATTGLVAAEHGLYAHLFDINPFLIWLGNAKCQSYSSNELKKLDESVNHVLCRFHTYLDKDNWIPSIHNIDRWWCGQTLKLLAALRAALVEEFGSKHDNGSSAIAWVAFCRLIIETSAAAFNHVSMSFDDKITTFERDPIADLYRTIYGAIRESAPLLMTGQAKILKMDARQPAIQREIKYTHVITSPPYPNRISYIRELRPYMYWMGFVSEARQAGELDWKTIGGTWGIATSRLADWKPERTDTPTSLLEVVEKIRLSDNKNAHLMAQYVHKYFHDMHKHFANLRQLLATRAKLSYIVGNSTFYGVQVHSEHLYEQSLSLLGYKNITSNKVRKRNCKKELYEFCVSASWQ